MTKSIKPTIQSLKVKWKSLKFKHVQTTKHFVVPPGSAVIFHHCPGFQHEICVAAICGASLPTFSPTLKANAKTTCARAVFRGQVGAGPSCRVSKSEPTDFVGFKNLIHDQVRISSASLLSSVPLAPSCVVEGSCGEVSRGFAPPWPTTSPRFSAAFSKQPACHTPHHIF